MPPKTSLLCTVIFCLAVTSMFSSCHNNGSSDGGNPVNNSYLASVRTMSTGTLLIDSFSYDDQHRVARFAQYATQGGAQGHLTYDFSFSGTSTLPGSYVYTFNNDAPDTHQLTFDGQGRITKDTTTGGSHFVTYYAYSGNYIICRVLFDGTTTDAQIDTLVVTDGNLTGEKVWGEDGGIWEQQGNVTFGHAAAANPAYKADIATSVGPLLFVLSVYNYGGHADYISKAVMNKVSGMADGLPSGGVNYTISVDGTGRVSAITPTGAGVPAGAKTVFMYY